MKIDEIRELVALLEQSELNMLEVCEGESRIRLEKAAPPQTPIAMTVPVPGFSQPAGVPGTPGTGSFATEEEFSVLHSAQGSGSSVVPGAKAVNSPMVGVFYSAPAPGGEPFVSVGSRVEKGDVLCIVEAMKLMNEITAEFSGEVAEVCCTDGEVVEYGQPLFYIK